MSYEQQVEQEYQLLKVKQAARQRLAAENMPPFEDLSLDEVMNEPPPRWVLPGVLPVGVTGLAGPKSQGKSLTVRDWLDSVANCVPWRGYRSEQPRGVTYVVGEGRAGIASRFAQVKRDRVRVCGPVCLTDRNEVDRFLKIKAEQDQALIVFDMVYHMGIAEENSAADTLPLLNAAQRIADELECAVVLVGHPPHSGERRFRGTSAFGGWWAAEYHMADGVFTCEKMKDGDTQAVLRSSYTISYPNIRWVTTSEVLSSAASLDNARLNRIRVAIELEPGISNRALAARLHEEFGVSQRQVERMAKEVKDGLAKEAETG